MYGWQNWSHQVTRDWNKRPAAMASCCVSYYRQVICPLLILSTTYHFHRIFCSKLIKLLSLGMIEGLLLFGITSYVGIANAEPNPIFWPSAFPQAFMRKWITYEAEWQLYPPSFPFNWIWFYWCCPDILIIVHLKILTLIATLSVIKFDTNTLNKNALIKPSARG